MLKKGVLRMFNKKVISYVVVAMLFAVHGDVAARKVTGKDAEALFEAPVVGQEDVVDASTVSNEDEELLNKDSLKDLKLKKGLTQLDSSAPVAPSLLDADENEQLALNDDIFNEADFEAFMNSPEMQEAMNSPEVKEMQKQLEELEKNNPEEFEKVMGNMLQAAMEQGAGIDFGAENQEVPAVAA
jgi:hypothetical protein